MRKAQGSGLLFGGGQYDDQTSTTFVRLYYKETINGPEGPFC